MVPNHEKSRAFNHSYRRYDIIELSQKVGSTPITNRPVRTDLTSRKCLPPILTGMRRIARCCNKARFGEEGLLKPQSGRTGSAILASYVR